MDSYDVLFIILVVRLCEISIFFLIKLIKNDLDKRLGKKPHSVTDEESWSASRILFYAAEAAKKDPDGHVALGHEWLFDKAETVAELEKALDKISHFYVRNDGLMGGGAIEIAKAALRESGNF